MNYDLDAFTEWKTDASPITLSLPLLKALYEYVEYTIEGTKKDLPKCSFRISNTTRAKGSCRIERPLFGLETRYTISISKKMKWTKRSLLRTFVHEVCHAMTYHETKTTGHNAYFWKLMTANGYPDGHLFEGEENTERSLYSGNDSDIKVGDTVSWEHAGKLYQGLVHRINKRRMTVYDTKRSKWLIPPSCLSKIK